MTKNIWCVGRNYKDHAKELGNPLPKNPLIFLKSGSCLTPNSSFSIAQNLGEIHYELEVALRFAKDLSFDAYTLALDLTAREQQKLAKEQGTPWTLAKSFKSSCPLGSWQSLTHISSLYNKNFNLLLNDKQVQTANTNEMLFDFNRLASYILSHFPVEAGDILLTGTPAGVGALKPGDQLCASMEPNFKVQWQVKN